jgi:hypothetical protein
MNPTVEHNKRPGRLITLILVGPKPPRAVLDLQVLRVACPYNQCISSRSDPFQSFLILCELKMVLADRLLLGAFLWRHVAAQTKAPPPTIDLDPNDDPDLKELNERNNNGTLSWYFGEERASKAWI